MTDHPTIAAAKAKRTDPLLDALFDAQPQTMVELERARRNRHANCAKLANAAERLMLAELERR